jgi:hypothetical protein
MKLQSLTPLRTIIAMAGATALASPVFGATLLYTVPAAAENGQLGASLAALGDLDADGIPDLAIGDPAFTEAGLAGSGQVQIVSGATGTVLHELLGTPAAGQAFGTALATLDANGDGTADLAVGATGGAGSVWIYSGTDGALIRTITPASPEAGSLYGASLANAGDQNADGKQDLFIGAPGSSSSDGAVAVASGADGTELGFFTADIPDTQFGASVAPVADVNADGKLDLVVGGPAANGGLGRVQLLFSNDGGELTSIFGAVAGAKLGTKLGGVDDRNADGVADLIVGSGSGGSAFLISGTDLATITDLSLAAAADLPVVPGGVFDIDANGTTEMLVGYPGATPLPKVDIIPDPLAPEPVSYDAASPAGGLGSAITVLPGFGFAFGEPLAEGGAVHVYGIVVDSDGDGVPDDQDQFPNSILTPTVIFGDVDTGVENRVNEDGASIADLFDALEPESGWKNHGQAVSSSVKLVKRLLRDGTIDASEAQALRSGVAQSNLGKGSKPAKPAKPEKPEKPAKPGKPEKPDKPAKPNKPNKN